MSDDNVTHLPGRPKPAHDALTVVHGFGGCGHRRFTIDERHAEVTCSDCNEKLSPMWVLVQLAQEDNRLRSNWAGMRAEIRLLGERMRVKCRSCGQFTPVNSRAKTEEIRALAEKIKAEESL